MKILMLSWEFPPYTEGGLGRHVTELSPALAQEGVDIHLLVPAPVSEPKKSILQPNLTVHWVDITTVDPNLDIYNRVLIINALMSDAASTLWSEEDGFDLIHAHDWLVSFVAIELKFAHKCPLVATIHATEKGRWRNNLLPDALSRKIDQAERSLALEAWRVIACSHYMINEICQHFTIAPDKLDMIPNGLNLNTRKTYSLKQLAQFRTKYTTSDQPLIFSIGRQVYEKGYQILIAAMSYILTDFPQAQLVLAGKGPLFDYLEQVAADFKVTDHVHLTGFITDEERDMFFSVADCAVFPSLYEPFGIVALEAMSFNCPVIVSNVGGLAEVVQHNKTGTLIYPDNPESTAWGILQVLQDTKQALLYTANAYRMVSDRYNWQLIAQETKLVYDRVLIERAQTRW